MVNGVSGYNQYAMNNMQSAMRVATSTAVLHKNDVENLVKFMNGQPVVSYQDPTIAETVKGTIPMMGLFGAFAGGATLKANGWNLKNTIANVKAASPYKVRSQALEAGTAELKNKFKDVLKKSVPVSSERNFIGKMLDKIPGYKAVRASGFGQLMGKTNAGWMAVLDGALETCTQVVPTFKHLGAKAGCKQIGKSAVKVGAGVVGWVGGDAIGRAAGAAIGTAICPGVGTAIGSFIGGFLGGIVGSAVCGKLAKKITGKSELELNNDKQIEQTAQQVEADNQTKAALAQQALQAAEQVLAQDPQNKDALAAKASAEKILAEVAQTQTAQQPQETVTAQAPVAQQTQFTTAMAGIPAVPGFNGFGYEMNTYKQAQSKASMLNMYPQNTTNPFMLPTQQQYTLNPYQYNNQALYAQQQVAK